MGVLSGRLHRRALSWLAIGLAAALAGCTVAEVERPSEPVSEHVSSKTKFSQAEYQVAASPRVTAEKRPRKGGGRYQVGKPYKVRGKWYHPTETPDARETGLASWYGPNFHGRLTANGEIYDQYSLSAAHPTMPLPSYAKVTNLDNGHEVMVRVNDRGPFASGRVIDLSARAAELLDFKHDGITKVKVEYAGRARMDGLDEEMLLASFRTPGSLPGNDGLSSGTMIAMAEPVSPATGVPGAVEAIDGGFQGGSVGLNGPVPVPTVRPTIFEGIPLSDGQIAYRGTAPEPAGPLPAQSLATPLAFAGVAAVDADNAFTAYLGEAPDARVELVLGLPADPAALDVMNRLFAGLGTVNPRQDGGPAVLSLREADANTALALAWRAGLLGAHLR